MWVCADLGVLQHSAVWGQRALARQWALGASLRNVTERKAETWAGSAQGRYMKPEED